MISHSASSLGGRVVDVVPEVAALQALADGMVAAELGRLRRRRPELSDELGGDVGQTLRRVVRQLLHHPTVLVCQTFDDPGGQRYRALLSELFDLKPPRPAAVTVVSAGVIDAAAGTTADRGRTATGVRPYSGPAHEAVAQVSSSGGRPGGTTPDTITTV